MSTSATWSTKVDLVFITKYIYIYICILSESSLLLTLTHGNRQIVPPAYSAVHVQLCFPCILVLLISTKLNYVEATYKKKKKKIKIKLCWSHVVSVKRQELAINTWVVLRFHPFVYITCNLNIYSWELDRVYARFIYIDPSKWPVGG